MPPSASSVATDQLLRDSFAAALAAADPLQVLAAHLPEAPPARVTVVGAGKAAASMALAVERHWDGRTALEGVVITRHAHGLPTRWIEVVEAGHPVPDGAGEQAAAAMLARARALGPDDLLLVLISGGGSSLMALPAPGLAMADLKALNRVLLASGAPIGAMNVVRKHVSAIAGGQLAAAAAANGARVLALVVSDVTGDDLSAIASGPCAPDPSTYADAMAIAARYALDLPLAVRAHLERGARGELPETPKPGSAVFARVEHRLIVTARASLDAAREFFLRQDIPAVCLGDSVTGEAREVAQVYAALVREIRAHAHPWPAPVALLSGGECTVTLRAAAAAGAGGSTGGVGGAGAAARGGRCSEFLLALGIELDGMQGVAALACDTDGIDGSEENAGAVLHPDSMARAAACGVNARACLDAHDAWGFFHACGGLVVTGPTRTNVNDYRVILIR